MPELKVTLLDTSGPIPLEVVDSPPLEGTVLLNVLRGEIGPPPHGAIGELIAHAFGERVAQCDVTGEAHGNAFQSNRSGSDDANPVRRRPTKRARDRAIGRHSDGAIDRHSRIPDAADLSLSNPAGEYFSTLRQ